VNSDVDYTELLRPMVTKDIPVSVDFSALEQLKGTLNEDMKWTTSNNPFAEATPVEDEEIHQAFNSHSNATFAECVDESDIMAADAGIDILGMTLEVSLLNALMRARMLVAGGMCRQGLSGVEMHFWSSGYMVKTLPVVQH